MNVYGQLKGAQYEWDDTAVINAATTKLKGHVVYNPTTDKLLISNGSIWVNHSPVDVSTVSFVGEVRIFKTFNGTLPIPAGWFVLGGYSGQTATQNDDAIVLNQTNYEAIHGIGTWVSHGANLSPLVNFNLPNVNYREGGSFFVGSDQSVDATQNGVAMASLGSHTKDLSHTHVGGSHTHPVVSTNHSNITGGGSDLVFFDGSVSGSGGNVATTSSLSSAQDIKPRSFGAFYIMRVI